MGTSGTRQRWSENFVYLSYFNLVYTGLEPIKPSPTSAAALSLTNCCKIFYEYVQAALSNSVAKRRPSDSFYHFSNATADLTAAESSSFIQYGRRVEAVAVPYQNGYFVIRRKEVMAFFLPYTAITLRVRLIDGHTISIDMYDRFENTSTLQTTMQSKIPHIEMELRMFQFVACVKVIQKGGLQLDTLKPAQKVKNFIIEMEPDCFLRMHYGNSNSTLWECKKCLSPVIHSGSTCNLSEIEVKHAQTKPQVWTQKPIQLSQSAPFSDQPPLPRVADVGFLDAVVPHSYHEKYHEIADLISEFLRESGEAELSLVGSIPDVATRLSSLSNKYGKLKIVLKAFPFRFATFTDSNLEKVKLVPFD